MSPTEVTKAPSEQASQGDLDLGPLAWVLEELRKSLDSAVKGVRRFVREAQEIRDSDLAALDTASLRTAKQQLHQSCGALDMVGMPQAALLLRAMESAVQYYVQKPQDCTDAVAQTLEKASFSLIEYLETILAGKHIPAVALFPQYRDVHSLFGSEGKVHPADLWPIERRLREPVIAREVTPLSYGPQVRKLLDACVLHIVKGVDVLPASARMREICLGFAQSQDDAAMRIFWKVGAAYFDAMAHGMLKADVYTKRVASRVLMLSAAITKGDPVAPDRLLQDMLFFCAQAAGKEGAERAQVLQAVYETFGLQRHLPVDYEQSRFGRFDPVLLAQARKRIASSTEIWSSLAGGDKSKIKPALDQFTLVCDSLTKLHPGSDRLSHALMQVMHSVAQEGQPPAPAVAMEVATAVLYLQAAFASLDMAEDAMDVHSATLAQRLEGVQAGQEPQPLETWMEQLYRQVSDQQTMGSVVGELRGTLAEAEKLLDQYFRNPSDLSALPSVAAHLSQMRGVLSVLGLDQASQAMVRMRQNVERLQSQQVPDDEQTVLFEKMGNSLGALGFLIDMLSYQRNMARKLYEFDEAEGELKLLMGRTRARASDGDAKASEQTLQARTQPIKPAPVVNALASAVAIATPSAPEADPVKRAVAQAVTDAVPLPVEPTEALKPLVMAATPAPAEPPVLSAPALAPALLVEHDDTDDELLGIFLEEAKEVVTNGRAALQLLVDDPANLSEQTILRRAFHTLKGSSRMVGLEEFGQAGWAMEQMLNAWLAEQKAMPQPMRQLALQALDGFESWAAAIEAGTAQFWQSAPFRASADAMRTQMRWIPLDMDAVRGQVSSSDVAEPVTAADSVHLQAADALALEAPAPVAADVLLGTDAVPDAAALLETAAFHAAPNILGLPPEGDPAPLLDAVAALSPRTQPEFEVEPEVVNAPEAQSLAEVSLPHLGIELDFLESVPTSTERSHIEHLAPEETLEITAQEPVEASALTAETIDFDEFEALLNAAGDGISAPILPPADELPALPVADELQPAQALQTIALTAEPALDVSAATYDTPAPEEETIQHIGDLSIPVPLYTVYLGEAESWSYRLLDALTGWQENLDEAQPDAAYAWAHSLAGSSATVGFKALSSLSRLLENALLHVQPQPHGVREQVSVFVQAAQEVRRMLHQFAAGCLSAANPQVLAQLQQILDAEIDVSLEMDVPAQPAASAEPGMQAELGVQAEPITQDQAMDAVMATSMV
ncbi:MAG: Hpt domain-containing protein, partial [Comamonas sp.]|nr:Hpt domain-containing protein [Candidatus Comamonas equi]